jgi:hypothetical protein
MIKPELHIETQKLKQAITELTTRVQKLSEENCVLNMKILEMDRLCRACNTLHKKICNKPNEIKYY